MNKEDHYFKVDRDILKINMNSLSKKALLLYLLYCRSINQPKNKGCSFIGFNASRGYLGNREAFLKAKEELVEKFLIQERPNVGTSFFKTTAVEVLNFPEFIEKENCFRVKKNCDHNHRTYKKNIKQYIKIPSVIIKKGFLKSMTLNGVYPLMFLYSETDLKNYWGVNFNVVHAYKKNSKSGFKKYCNFGDGFSRDIYQRECVQALEPDIYFICNSHYNGDLLEGLKTLLDCELFRLIPVIVKSDPEDDDICFTIKEVFNGLVVYKDNEECRNSYLFVKPGKNEKVIWILRPIYFVKNKEYKLFQEMTDKIYDYEYNLYNFNDIATSKQEKIKLIKEEDFEYFLSEWKGAIYEKVEEYFVDLSEQDIEEIIRILPGYVYRVYEDKYKSVL